MLWGLWWLSIRGSWMPACPWCKPPSLPWAGKGWHFGGWSIWEKATEILGGRRIWVDTSSSLYSISPETARRLIDAYGVDHVLFGSDFPMWKPKEELERFMKIPLTNEEREKILWKNAAELLRL